MFTENFDAVDSLAVASALKDDGVFVVHEALAPEAIAAIEQDVERYRTGFNRNGITGAYYFHQYYMCHMLAISRAFTELVTHPKILDITEQVVGDQYRLKALRYYETYGRHHMEWHTDNKTDRGFSQIPGIIFIAYLSDVEEGEFQYVRGSHKWSGENAYNVYTGEYVEQTLSKDIIGFPGRAGTIVIYDTYGIHRAMPVPRADFVRKSLFWQIDREISRAEPILLNPEFLPSPDPRTLRYLGFGLPTEYDRFPKTDVQTITAKQMAPEDFRHLHEEMTHDVRTVLHRTQMILHRTQNDLADARTYIKTMPLRDISKVIARAILRGLDR